jgi:hypothetical protein
MCGSPGISNSIARPLAITDTISSAYSHAGHSSRCQRSCRLSGLWAQPAAVDEAAPAFAPNVATTCARRRSGVRSVGRFLQRLTREAVAEEHLQLPRCDIAAGMRGGAWDVEAELLDRRHCGICAVRIANCNALGIAFCHGTRRLFLARHALSPMGTSIRWRLCSTAYGPDVCRI